MNFKDELLENWKVWLLSILKIGILNFLKINMCLTLIVIVPKMSYSKSLMHMILLMYHVHVLIWWSDLFDAPNIYLNDVILIYEILKIKNK